MPTIKTFVWADIPESAQEWHAKRVSEAAAAVSGKVHMCEKLSNGFEDIIMMPQEQYMSVYSFPGTMDIERLQSRFRLSEDATVPEGVRFNSRFAKEIRRFESEDYAEKKSEIQDYIVTFFRPRNGTQEQVLSFLYDEFYPALMADPITASVQVYQATSAVLFADGAYQTPDFDPECDFISVFEMISHDLPFDAMVVMGESENFRKLFDEGTEWRGAQFELRRTFPEGLPMGLESEETSNEEVKSKVDGVAHSAQETAILS